jgi:hypothetical protein
MIFCPDRLHSSGKGSPARNLSTHYQKPQGNGEQPYFWSWQTYRLHYCRVVARMDDQATSARTHQSARKIQLTAPLIAASRKLGAMPRERENREAFSEYAKPQPAARISWPTDIRPVRGAQARRRFPFSPLHATFWHWPNGGVRREYLVRPRVLGGRYFGLNLKNLDGAVSQRCFPSVPAGRLLVRSI